MAIHWTVQSVRRNPHTIEIEGYDEPMTVPAELGQDLMRCYPQDWKVVNKNTEVQDKMGAPISNMQWKTDGTTPEHPPSDIPPIPPKPPKKPPLPIEQQGK